MSSYISSYTNKKPFIHQRESSTSSSSRSSSDSYYSDKYYSSSSSTSSMANKDYRSSSGPRVEHLRDPHADLKKVKVTHRDGTSTYEYRAGRSEDNAPSSSEAYDYQNYHKSSEIKERRDRDKKSKSSSRR